MIHWQISDSWIIFYFYNISVLIKKSALSIFQSIKAVTPLCRYLPVIRRIFYCLLRWIIWYNTVKLLCAIQKKERTHAFIVRRILLHYSSLFTQRDRVMRRRKHKNMQSMIDRYRYDVILILYSLDTLPFSEWWISVNLI